MTTPARRAARVTVMCGHGAGAATIASELERAGAIDVQDVAGGPDGWANATGKPVATVG